jgi:hypothetical protein
MTTKRVILISISTAISLTLVSGSPEADNRDIVINEIMYDPGSGLEEWIELFNRGSVAVDIQGWTIEDPNASPQIIASSSLIIPPGGYMVLSGSTSLTAFPSAKPIRVTNFPSLNNSGDTITLKDSTSAEVDSVVYDGDIGGKGVSMERRSPFGGSSKSSNWSASTSPDGGTPGKVNSVYTAPPAHNLSVLPSDVRITPPNPSVGTTATIQALVVNEGSSQETVEVGFYQGHPDKGGSTISKDALVLPAGASAFRSTAWTPTEPDVVYNIYIKIESVGGEVTLDDNIAFISVPIGKVTYRVVINEIMYSPLEGGTEWIELYNAGDTEVDARGWGVSDDSIIGAGDDPKAITTTPQPLAPGGYLILTPDKDKFLRSFFVSDEESVIEVSSMPSLNDDGDTFRITDPIGNVVDSVSYARSWGGGKGLSLERTDPNGPSDDRGNWDSSADPRGGTPLGANSRFGLGRDLKGALLKVEPKVFSPHSGESALILYDVPAEAVVTLYIFDIRGRFVHRLFSEKEAGGKRGIVWDGKNQEGRIVPIGYYIVYLETVLPRRAGIGVAKETVVVGKRLN